MEVLRPKKLDGIDATAGSVDRNASNYHYIGCACVDNDRIDVCGQDSGKRAITIDSNGLGDGYRPKAPWIQDGNLTAGRGL